MPSTEAAKNAYLKGVELFQQRDYHGAIKELTAAIREDHHYTEAYFYKAAACFELKDTEAALKEYRHVLEYDPGQWAALLNMGMVQKNVGRFREAIDKFGEALDIKKDIAIAYYYRAESNFYLKHYPEAVSDITLFLKYQPKDLNGYSFRGAVYSEMGDTRNAIKDLEQASRIDPKHPVPLYNLGVIYEQSGDIPKAKEYLKKASALGFVQADERLRKFVETR